MLGACEAGPPIRVRRCASACAQALAPVACESCIQSSWKSPRASPRVAPAAVPPTSSASARRPPKAPRGEIWGARTSPTAWPRAALTRSSTCGPPSGATSRSCRPTTTCSRRTSRSSATPRSSRRPCCRPAASPRSPAACPRCATASPRAAPAWSCRSSAATWSRCRPRSRLSHDMFDGVLMLGVCDKIVPGLLIGALSFGHLPTVFVPAGPMPSGLPNGEKSRIRQLPRRGRDRPRRAARGRARRPTTRPAPAPSTAPRTPTSSWSRRWACTCPGASFVNPGTTCAAR